MKEPDHSRYGHPWFTAELGEDGYDVLRYVDDGSVVDYNEPPRPCVECGLLPDPDDGVGGADPCFGVCGGVKFACCGHGSNLECPYFVANDGLVAYFPREVSPRVVAKVVGALPSDAAIVDAIRSGAIVTRDEDADWSVLTLILGETGLSPYEIQVIVNEHLSGD